MTIQLAPELERRLRDQASRDLRRPLQAHRSELIPLEEQDRSLWKRDLIEEGLALLDKALRHRRPADRLRVGRRPEGHFHLLAGPEFARHMQLTFDVLLMDRRPAKHVPLPQWQEFLRTSFAANKPYDQLVRDLIARVYRHEQHAHADTLDKA